MLNELINMDFHTFTLTSYFFQSFSLMAHFTKTSGYISKKKKKKNVKPLKPGVPKLRAGSGPP